jgi:hypothetical protein
MIRPGLALLPAAALLALAHPLAAGAGPVAQAYVPTTSCRAVDTRGPAGPNGGPALGANEVRVFTIAGTCGVPANALGLVVNLTVFNPAALGYAQLFAGDAPVPPTTVLGFNAHRTRAGFAFVALAANGSGTVALANGSAGGADYILDVEGYFVLACTSPITVTNPATATGAVSAPFSQTFTSSGGVGAKTYTTSSPLPAGLTLAANGSLSGTPTQPGTFPITVTATDQNGCTGTGPTYTLVIACQSIAVTNPGVTAGTANTPFSQTFTQTGGVGATTFSTVNALPVGMTLAANGVLSGTPTQAGGFDIVVTATDANGCTGAGATYHLVINCQTITVTNPATASGTVNAAFSQTFTQAGAIGAATFSTASALPAGLALAANGLLSGTPTQKGTFPIVVKVTDGNLCTGTAATYNLSIGCQAIGVGVPATSTATSNTPFSQTFTVTNTVGTVTFTTASTLPTGLTLAASGVLSGTPTQTGSFPIVVTATDANGCAGISATYTLVVGCQTWSVGPATLPQATTSVAYPAVTFTHSGGIGSVTFTEGGALPNGITFAAGVLSGTPTQSGSFPITVTATDANGCTASRDYLLVVVCSGTSITLSPSTLPTVAAGSVFPSTTFTATGGTGPYSFQKAGVLPAGMTFTTDTLSGTPTQTGTFPITISAIDSVGGCVGSQDYVVTVTCVGVTITVAPPTLASGPVGTAYGPVTFTASGGTSPYTFAKTGALPPGMTFAAGVLSGTPTIPGTFPIVVTATDAAGCVGAASYSLVTTCPTITVTNPATATGTAGTAFSQTFTQSGGNGAVTFSTTSTLPTGLTLSSTGLLSGTTTQTGSFPIVVKATDANGCTGAGATYTLVISCQTINVTNPGTATGTAGVAFDQVFTATGNLGTLTWSTASTLPTGLTLSSTGHLSGTPTQTGSFPIVVKATDANGCFGTSATYTLVVTCPTITVTRTGGGSFPAGTFSTAYIGQSVAASGSAGTPFTFAVTAGALPGGLALATGGAISGTPTATGVFSFTVTATDQYGCTGSQAFSISVAPKLTAKSYADVANTQLAGGVAAPATPSVSAVALSSGDSSDTTITYAVTVAPTHGALSTFNAAGTFLYTPSVGNTTSDSFTYTGTSNGVSATQTATIAFSGKVWYVDNATASGTNDGRSNTPFKTMTAVGGAGTGSGEFIYVAKGSGSTTGAYTMLASQQLIGAGATLNVPTVSPILTVAGNAANTPTLSGTLTLANSVTTNGFDMSTTTSDAITGGGTGVSVAARNVTTTTGRALNVTSGNGSLTFQSISVNGASNGIVLTNFGGAGLTVTGNAGACTLGTPTCTGGTIQNTTGDGVVLTATKVNLSFMRIKSSFYNGIDGTSLTGFSLTDVLVDANTTCGAACLGGLGGSPGGFSPAGILLTSLNSASGNAVTRVEVTGSTEDNVRVRNDSGSNGTITFDTCKIHDNSTASGNMGIFVQTVNTGVLTATVQNSTFQGNRTIALRADTGDASTLTATFTNNTITAGSPNQGNQGIEVSRAVTSTLTFNVSGNTVTGMISTLINVFSSGGPGAATGVVKNNVVTGTGVGGNQVGIRLFNSGSSAVGFATMNVNVANNTVTAIDNAYPILGESSGSTGPGGLLKIAVTGNTANVAVGGTALDSIRLQSRNLSTVCAAVSGNTTNSGGSGFFGIQLREANSSVFNLEGLTSGSQTDPTVHNFVVAQNPSGGTVGTLAAVGNASITGVAAASCGITP